MTEARPWRRWTRRVVGITLVGGLLGAAVATYQLAPALPRTAPGPVPAASAGPASAASRSSASDPSSPSSPSGDGTSTTPSAGPSGPPQGATDQLPTALPDGPGTTEPGVAILATPNADGSFEVVEQVRLTGVVLDLQLRSPALDQAGQDFARLTARAVEVQGTASGQPVQIPGGTVREPVDVELPVAADAFTLRYRLEGTLIRSVPSTAGRARAAIGPLVGDVADGLPVAVTVTGPTVRNLQCPSLELDDQSCAAGNPPGLRLERPLPWKDSLVVVQLDLPLPR